jgi:hypothetical protein
MLREGEQINILLAWCDLLYVLLFFAYFCQHFNTPNLSFLSLCAMDASILSELQLLIRVLSFVALFVVTLLVM